MLVQPEHVNFGLAIDLKKDDGQRQLVVPNIKAAETLDFRQFWAAYEEVVRKARSNKLTIDDYAGTTISLTNPGTIGTVHSVPRLMPGQGTHHRRRRDGVPGRVRRRVAPRRSPGSAISKIMTLTSTYDHRIIQGAQSGDFLRRDPPAAARRGRLLRRDLRGAADPVRAGPLGARTSAPPTRTTSPRSPGCTS